MTTEFRIKIEDLVLPPGASDRLQAAIENAFLEEVSKIDFGTPIRTLPIEKPELEGPGIMGLVLKRRVT